MTFAHTPLALLAAAGGALLALGCASGPSGVEAEPRDDEATSALDEAPAARGQAAADAMLATWRAKHPDATWEADARARYRIASPYDNSALLRPGAAEGEDGELQVHPGRAFTERDLLIWERETERLVLEGARIFHSAEELGSSIGVSCDMCHPDGAGTHPETYPKYQIQLGRAVLLREMILWCIEHPVRGECPPESGHALRALEAYLYAQRSGTPLAYGKH